MRHSITIFRFACVFTYATVSVCAVCIPANGAEKVLQPSRLAKLLPDTICGWTARGEGQFYTSQTIYDYLDGGADIYLAYGCKGVESRTYAKAGLSDIVADVYDMATPADAFGVFMQSGGMFDQRYGQGARYEQGLLLFWKDHYLFSILATPETEISKRAVLDIAGVIDKSIVQSGAMPAILRLLPQESLVKESLRYFHNSAFLNTHCFIMTGNALHIDDSTQAVLAEYRVENKKAVLLVIRYVDSGKAQRAYNDFAVAYNTRLKKNRIVQVNDTTWVGCQLTEGVVSAVFNAPSKAEAGGLLETVEEKVLHAQKNEKQ